MPPDDFGADEARADQTSRGSLPRGVWIMLSIWIVGLVYLFVDLIFFSS